ARPQPSCGCDGRRRGGNRAGTRAGRPIWCRCPRGRTGRKPGRCMVRWPAELGYTTMTTLAIVLLMAAAVFAIRISGFIAARLTIPAAWERVLGYVPIATLTALVIASLSGRDEQMSIGIVAAIVAAAISWR